MSLWRTKKHIHQISPLILSCSTVLYLFFFKVEAEEGVDEVFTKVEEIFDPLMKEGIVKNVSSILDWINSPTLYIRSPISILGMSGHVIEIFLEKND